VALADGRFEDALHWLHRARRLAPNDPAVALTLATIYLGSQPNEAVRLASEAVATAPTREARLCLIAARLRAGDTRQALADLHGFLARFAVDNAAAALAASVCAAGRAADGWCGIGFDGRLVVPAQARLSLSLDGKPLRLAAAIRPRTWPRESRLQVTAEGRDLIGSPIDLAAQRRIEGVVEAGPDGSLRGWCWQPSSPEATPHLVLRDAAGKRRLIPVGGPAATSHRLFARHRTFVMRAADLAGLRPPLRVCAVDGRHLLGSPIDPGLEARSSVAVARAGSAVQSRWHLPAFIPSPAAPRGTRLERARRHHPAVIMPVFNGAQAVAACLDSVLANTPRPVPIIVVDDGSTDAGTVALLDGLAAARSIRLIRHAENRGFPAAANTGMRAAHRHDAVLLNSDVLTPPGWLEAVQKAAYAAADIGTASPLSNDATILNYPGRTPSPPPDLAATARLATLAARAAGHAVVDLPTTVGFCMYIRRDCLDEVGAFREDLFAQGYGEENDFCLRARHLGWRHVAALGTYVTHQGGASFGTAKQHLIERNLAVLERLHPGWLALVEAHAADDPLFAARRRIDRLRWREHVKRSQRSVILVTHNDGGGVERVVRRRAEALAAAGGLPVLLRPAEAQSVRIHPGLAEDLPDLRYRLPEEWPACIALLQSARPERIEFHHMLGHTPALLELSARLGLPYEVVVHDYAWLCPRITLVGSNGQYCGEPDARECDRCIADAGRLIEEEIDTAALRRRSAVVLSLAAAVTTPSADTRDRLRRHFPGTEVHVVAHEIDRPRPEPPGARRSQELVVAVLGALGIEKGYDVLLKCARDAADRNLALRFVLIGHSIDDTRLLQTGRCFVTGPYQEGEAAGLIAQEGARLGLVPSIWPETWCFALSEIWRAGLQAASFDIGAPAERIRATGAGFVLPLGLGAAAVNNALLAAARQIGHV
jgi:GT2 family glycosyltransferase/glycosyltransferase involved in cell wall biosynthesis